MDSFALACDKVNKTLTDIEGQWKPFIPGWYMQKHFPSSSIPGPTTIVATPASINAKNSKNPTALIIGVVIGGVLLLALIGGGFYIHKVRKAKKAAVTDKAMMADQLHGEGGIAGRINQLLPIELKSRSSYGSLGTTHVGSGAGIRTDKQVDSPLIGPEYYGRNQTAASSVYNQSEGYGGRGSYDRNHNMPVSDVKYARHGYPIRSPPPTYGSPTPRPLRPLRSEDNDEFLPVARSSFQAPNELGDSPVYNERGVKTHRLSQLLPVKTLSHSSPVYDKAGHRLGYEQDGISRH